MPTEAIGAARPPPAEPRWPVALAIVAVLAVLILLPARVRILPPWALYAAGIPLLAPLLAAALRPQSAVWPRIERIATFIFAGAAGGANVAILGELIYDIIARSQAVDGLHLFSSSIAVWATNVLMFSLIYWQLDRGGPGSRASATPNRPDWIFGPEQGPPEASPPGWRPAFIDYLFLAYSTATAFSAADGLPLTGRAKFAMMAESAVSLVTLVVVAARAISILGS
jgi:hypothetical protein